MPVYNNYLRKDNAAMRIRRAIPVAVLCLWSLPIWCQGALQDHLDSVYRGKTLLLRNFYSGSDLRYDQSGNLISGGVPSSWTLASMEITSVTLGPQEVEIAGNRIGTRYLVEKREFLRIGKIKLHIAHPAAIANNGPTLEPVLAKIFIEPGEDLRPMLPDYWSYYLSGTDLPSRRSAWKSAVALGPPGTRPSGTAPKPLKTPDPKYTKEAASKRIEGTTILEAIIDASGSPTHIGIVQPLGMGLDEQAVATMAQWRFRPSTSNGQPIPAPLEVQLAFKCCP